ncbi:SMP-30/Gluconolactonase/LRE-like region [Macleaya cordata]|uniref:SMP-30/Gluconolactonase/LRE-like region n=1 Tax=Macleaya cordata TaxID=56857 RepID=A0A200QVR1_MACCD|nr:SMP-30/Gluconolactonase/LRE-like region [Macleaya cordata]
MASVSVSSKTPILLFFSLLILLFSVGSTTATNRHIINFRSTNLFPESIVWDPSAQHFLVSSLRHPTIHAVSDAGVVESLIHDTDLPANVSIGGITIDSVNRRLLAVIHASDPLPQIDFLAAYDLRTSKRLFLAPLTDDVNSDRPIANDVAVDFKGNAFITNSAGNFIWKVNDKGEPSIFSRSSIFTSQHVEPEKLYSFCGLNGITYISKGYLLVVQSNSGKMFKVDADDGKARLVLLNKNLTAADGIAVRDDGVVVVVSHHTAWLLKSDDSWGEGVVYDEIALDVKKFASGVAVRNDNRRLYVLYGNVDEGMMGNVEREEFGIEEIESEKESAEEKIWIYILVGFGLAYFMYWRFQMGQLRD